MRTNQVSIKIERFADQVPKSYPEQTQRITVYADANNLYEALATAFSGVLEEVQKYENVPSFGCCEIHLNALDNPDDILIMKMKKRFSTSGKNFLNGDSRDPERIDPMMRKLIEAWKLNPDLRLGQLIIDCAKQSDIFSIEDDEMFEKIRNFINASKKQCENGMM